MKINVYKTYCTVCGKELQKIAAINNLMNQNIICNNCMEIVKQRLVDKIDNDIKHNSLKLEEVFYYDDKNLTDEQKNNISKHFFMYLTSVIEELNLNEQFKKLNIEDILLTLNNKHNSFSSIIDTILASALIEDFYMFKTYTYEAFKTLILNIDQNINTVYIEQQFNLNEQIKDKIKDLYNNYNQILSSAMKNTALLDNISNKSLFNNFKKLLKFLIYSRIKNTQLNNHLKKAEQDKKLFSFLFDSDLFEKEAILIFQALENKEYNKFITKTQQAAITLVDNICSQFCEDDYDLFDYSIDIMDYYSTEALKSFIVYYNNNRSKISSLNIKDIYEIISILKRKVEISSDLLDSYSAFITSIINDKIMLRFFRKLLDLSSDTKKYVKNIIEASNGNFTDFKTAFFTNTERLLDVLKQTIDFEKNIDLTLITDDKLKNYYTLVKGEIKNTSNVEELLKSYGLTKYDINNLKL